MALVQKPGRKVWIFKTKVNGKTWERSTGERDRRKAEARVPELKRLARLHRERPEGSLRLSSAIIREVTRLEGDVSAQQALRVSTSLEGFLGWAGDQPLDKINTAMVERYQRRRLKKVARSTVDKDVCYILRLLRENGFEVRRPSSKTGSQTEVRPFTDDELKRFFAHCEGEQRVLFMLMLATGARPTELIPSNRSNHVALVKDDLDPEKNRVRIRSSKNRRGREGPVRWLQVPDEMMEMVVDLARRKKGPQVFSPNQSFCQLFDRILTRAEIEKIDVLGHKLIAHSFRHSFATKMAEAVGHNPFVVKQMLGHTQITTTDRYCHPTAPALVIDVSAFVTSDSSQARGGTSGGNVIEKGAKQIA